MSSPQHTTLSFPGDTTLPKALRKAFHKGDVQAVESALQKLASQEVKDASALLYQSTGYLAPLGSKPLLWPDAIAILLTRFSWPETKNQEGVEPLPSQYMEVALRLGANPNLAWKTEDGNKQLLVEAVKQATREPGLGSGMIKHLLDHHANPNDPNANISPLTVAASGGLSQAALLLLKSGADPSPVCHHASSPMTNAIRGNHAEIVGHLLDYGVSIDAKLSEGYTPLEMSIKHKKEEVMHLLLSRNASPNEGGIGPAWFLAIAPNLSHLLPTLFEYGADINLRTKDFNFSALHEWCERFEHGLTHRNIPEETHAACAFLIEQGVDIEAKDTQGKTAHDWAITNLTPELIKVIDQEAAIFAAKQLNRATVKPIVAVRRTSRL